MRYPLRALVVLVLAVGVVLVGLPAPAPAAADAGAGAPVRSAVVGGLAPAAGLGLFGATGTVSRPLGLPFPSSMVALALPAGATAELRATPPGGAPGPWLEVEAHEDDEGPDPRSPEAVREALVVGDRVLSDPLWVTDAAAVEVRLVGGELGDVAVHAIDSMGLSRSLPERALDALRAAWSQGRAATPAVAATPATTATDQPAIADRAAWGADEQIVGGEPTIRPTVRNAFVHHTVNGNGYSEAEAAGVVRGIQRYHVGRGWDDIGYNFLIDRFGTIYEGRVGGIEEAVQGAQAGGFNAASTGVAIIGDLSKTAASAATVEALTELLAWKLDLHHADVLGRLQVESGGSSRYAEGVVVELDRLSGHRDVSTTTCPASIYGLLPDLRQAIAERQGPVLVDPLEPVGEVRVAAGRNLDEPVALGARLRPAGDWSITVRGPDGTVVEGTEGSGEHAAALFDASGLERGTYAFEVAAADGRRPVTGEIELIPPEVTDLEAPEALGIDAEGDLVDPFGATAGLWEGARWRMELTDPSGEVVASAEGEGDEAALHWEGPATVAGAYELAVTADDVEPARTGVLVTRRVLERVADDLDPVAASVALSRAGFEEPESAAHAVLARADVFADALAGGPLAGTDGPVLLTGSTALDERVAAELDRVLSPSAPVYVLGGEAALSPAVAAALAPHPVVRLQGSERTGTAVAIADVVLARGGGSRVLLARAGPDDERPWADALAGGAWGARTATPVLLTSSARLSAPTADLLERRGVTQTLVLGGQQAIGAEVLDAVPGGRRIAGDDRAGTAVAIARELWGRTEARTGDAFVLVDGYRADAWTWALSATPLAAGRGAPLLIGAEEGLPTATAAYLSELGYDERVPGAGIVVGPAAAVSEATVATADALLR